MAFLDNNGVTALVTRLKNYFALKTDIPTVPTSYTSSPKMDGTASAGTGTTYARGNHVHPHDTSKQDTLVSGTNIKTINGESILGSGNLAVGGLPTVSASDNGKVLTVANGEWVVANLPVYNGEVE